MSIIDEIFHNKYIWIPALLWLLIQIFKVATDLVVNKRLNVRRIVGAGGMPSSHSAVVCSIATCIGKDCGFGSAIFGLSFIMAFIVMYDAAGVRRAAGKQAQIINKLLETPGMSGVEVQGKLVEMLGHTPIQVFVGAILGIVVGAIF